MALFHPQLLLPMGPAMGEGRTLLQPSLGSGCGPLCWALGAPSPLPSSSHAALCGAGSWAGGAFVPFHQGLRAFAPTLLPGQWLFPVAWWQRQERVSSSRPRGWGCLLGSRARSSSYLPSMAEGFCLGQRGQGSAEVCAIASLFGRELMNEGALLLGAWPPTCGPCSAGGNVAVAAIFYSACVAAPNSSCWATGEMMARGSCLPGRGGPWVTLVQQVILLPSLCRAPGKEGPADCQALRAGGMSFGVFLHPEWMEDPQIARMV